MNEVMNATTNPEVHALVAEIERRAKAKHDVIVPARQFRFETNPALGGMFGQEGPAGVHVALPSGIGDAVSAFGLTKNGHAQTAAKLNIPKAYYDRMLGQGPSLLAENVNYWAGRDDRNWMLRTLDGNIRANLSDRYRALDNYDLFFAAAKTAKDAGANISRVSLTEDRFEMRLIAPDWQESIDLKKALHRDEGGHSRPKPDSILIPGAYVANSETGRGGLSVRPFILDLVCTNGMVGEKEFARVHLGGQNDLGILSDETVSMKDRALWGEVTDTIRATFDRERFRNMVDRLRDAASQELTAPIEAVDAVVKHFEMDDDDKQAILNELISPSHDRDPGRTVFGLMSAITERAKAYQGSDPERATTLEQAGLVFAQKARELVEVRVR